MQNYFELFTKFDKNQLTQKLNSKSRELEITTAHNSRLSAPMMSHPTSEENLTLTIDKNHKDIKQLEKELSHISRALHLKKMSREPESMLRARLKTARVQLKELNLKKPLAIPSLVEHRDERIKEAKTLIAELEFLIA